MYKLCRPLNIDNLMLVIYVFVNSSPSLTSPTCAFCRRVSESRQPMTSASSIRHRQLRLSKQLLPSAATATCCSVVSEDASKTLVKATGDERIDYSVIFCSSASLMDRWAGCSRFIMPPLVWYSALRPHNAGAPSTTLATGTPAHRFQGCHTCSSVAVRKYCITLSW